MNFSRAVIEWQKKSGRHDLPWQNSTDPYRIWVSEIMLQQTQVTTVISYYERFLQRFPNVTALAQAPVDDVLALWAGLGYYSRGRNMHRAAQMICDQHAGQFPREQDVVMQLPGIGRSTAAAILAFSSGQALPILDGNVKRVLCRFFGVHGDPSSKATVDQLWQLAQQQMPKKEVQAYTQGVMDLGATLCTRSKPRCTDCPLTKDCYAQKNQLQSTLPERKKAKVVPIRAQVFLIIRQANRVVLQRQAASGIWGGLFSLPRLLQIQATEAELKANYKTAVTKKSRLNANQNDRADGNSQSLFFDSSWLDLTQQWLASNASALNLPLTPPYAQTIQLTAHFTHAFSHYKLLGICLEVRLAALPSGAALTARDSGAQDLALHWFDPVQARQVGLPAPIAQLLLFDPANTD